MTGIRQCSGFQAGMRKCAVFMSSMPATVSHVCRTVRINMVIESSKSWNFSFASGQYYKPNNTPIE
jgi:hypothetical protein